MSDQKSCNICRFCLLHDYGYSNFTTEGIDSYCLKEHRGDFDNWYGGETKSVKYAENCPHYKLGDPVSVDFDHEGYCRERTFGQSYSPDDSEVARLLDVWYVNKGNY